MVLLSYNARPDSAFAMETSSNINGIPVEPVGGDSQVEPSIPLHPLGIKPLGNRYLSSGPTARICAGSLQALPDEMLAMFLEYLDPRSLRLLGCTCRFLYAFCASDDLWKDLFLEAGVSGTAFTWLGSWRSTYLNLPVENQVRVDCSNVFSDVLHRPFVCSNIALGQYSSNIPKANMIARFEDLSYEDFTQTWSDKPFILTRRIREWPAYQTWNLERLLANYSDVEFRAEAVDWPFATYYRYMFSNHDESPLYLFDKKFAEKMKIAVGAESGAAYWKPDCFGPDLFELLGHQRPAHRWLIIGPERSGSTFHKDPNSTSAWNAVLQGAKYWIMFPPSAQVPGVYVSKDGGEVTSPLSIAEWLLGFHAEARRTPGCIEGICSAGEILHVPSGWWHLVVNLENGIALTQNFVPDSHLPSVLSFLKDKAEQVSGFSKDIEDPYSLFVDRLKEQQPGMLSRALEELIQKQERRKRRWDMAVGGADDEEGQSRSGFSFAFGGDEDDEIP